MDTGLLLEAERTYAGIDGFSCWSLRVMVGVGLFALPSPLVATIVSGISNGDGVRCGGGDPARPGGGRDGDRDAGRMIGPLGRRGVDSGGDSERDSGFAARLKALCTLCSRRFFFISTRLCLSSASFSFCSASIARRSDFSPLDSLFSNCVILILIVGAPLVVVWDGLITLVGMNRDGVAPNGVERLFVCMACLLCCRRARMI